MIASIGNTIQLSIGKLQVQGLVDTGAAISVVSEQYYNKISKSQNVKIENGGLKFAKGVGGTVLHLKGVCFLPLKFGSVSVTHAFYVCQNISHDLIIGYDFLNANKVIVNFQEGALFIQNE